MSPRRKDRLLLVNAGNTTCALVVCENGRLARAGSLPTARVDTDTALAAARAAAGRGRFDGTVLCSVRPDLNEAWLAALGAVARTPPLMVRWDLSLGMLLRYPRPETIGADRLANACAAVARFPGPVAALDFGTAVTCDVVDRRGAFIGGIIAPGARLMLDYLHERTALLPKVAWQPVRRLVGRSTEEAIQIGAWHACRGLVRELLAGLHKELGDDLSICATGGDAVRMKPFFDSRVTVVPLLTFEGMRAIYRRQFTKE